MSVSPLPLSGTTRLHGIVGDSTAQAESPEGVSRAFAQRSREVVCPLATDPPPVRAYRLAASTIADCVGTLPAPTSCIAAAGARGLAMVTGRDKSQRVRNPKVHFLPDRGTS